MDHQEAEKSLALSDHFLEPYNFAVTLLQFFTEKEVRLRNATRDSDRTTPVEVGLLQPTERV